MKLHVDTKMVVSTMLPESTFLYLKFVNVNFCVVHNLQTM